MNKLPPTMRAARLHSFSETLEGLQVETIPTPQPGPGEVLVKVAASPVNPSDIGYLIGAAYDADLPAVPGFEGSGVVVAGGRGILPRYRLGHRVAFATQGGAWAEYVNVSALQCFPVRKNVTLEAAGMSVVNPVSAWALIEMARKGPGRGLVVTGANSQLGRMLWRLGKRHGLAIINVVRREAALIELREEGREHILNSSDPDFEPDLRKLCISLDVRRAADLTSGSGTKTLLNALPDGSHLTGVGTLEREDIPVPFPALLHRGFTLDGYLLPTWFETISPLTLLRMYRAVPKLMESDFRSTVRARYPLAKVKEAVETYAGQLSGGKVLILPGE